MNNCAFSLLGAIFLFLHLSHTDAVPLQALVEAEDSLIFNTSPPTGHPNEPTTTLQGSIPTSKVTAEINAPSSENTFTKYESTQGSEEITSTTVGVVMPTTEVPPCLKETNRINDLLNKYSMLGIEIADLSSPDCDHNGFYKPLQCHFHGCYCVDRYGTPTSKFNHEGFDLSCVDPGIPDIADVPWQ